jgi:spore coat protein CotH
LNSLRQNLKYLYFTSIFFLAIGCNGPENLDLTNIGNEVITFNDDVDDEIIFPSMYITSFNNQEIVDDPKIDAELYVLEDEIETKYNIGIEIRGSSSQMFPKKSYGFETKTEDYSDDLDVSIGGFPEEEDWILYGPYSDKSLIRNKLTFDLSNSIGYKASKVKFYNLFINNDFKGLYLLMEKIKRDENRVDIY